jgi:hypothetical protein
LQQRQIIGRRRIQHVEADARLFIEGFGQRNLSVAIPFDEVVAEFL